MIGADVLGRQHEAHAHDRLAELFDVALLGHLLRRVDLELFAVVERDLVSHVRRGLHQVDVGLLLEPLLDDLHVQQAQKAAAEAEAQRVARFRLELEAGIVDRAACPSASRSCSKSWPSDGYRPQKTIRFGSS